VIWFVDSAAKHSTNPLHHSREMRRERQIAF